MIYPEKSDVIYRSIKEPAEIGILAAGFMRKNYLGASQYEFSNDFYSCFLVLSGTGYYSDSEHSGMMLQSGDFVQRIPGRVHTTEITLDDQWLEFFISFGRPVYTYLCELGFLDPTRPVIQGAHLPNDWIMTAFTHFLEHLKSADSTQLQALLLNAQSLVLAMTSQNEKTLSHPYQRQIVQACERLSTRFQDQIDYQKIADSLNMSYENFRKIFKELIGVSPAKFHTQEKIKQATLMLESGLSIREVALLTGYSDVFAFSKQFKKTTGISPGSLRHTSN